MKNILTITIASLSLLSGCATIQKEAALLHAKKRINAAIRDSILNGTSSSIVANKTGLALDWMKAEFEKIDNKLNK